MCTQLAKASFASRTKRMEAVPMPVAVDYDLTIREADKALRAAQTADDVRNVWKKHMGVLGHRTLGRLLLGRSAAELIAKRDERGDSAAADSGD
jgi:hypothetical protein